MATRASKSESKQKTAARHRRLREGDKGALVVRPRGNGRSGRAIGQHSVQSRQAKDNLEEAFLKLGGVAGLVKWGKNNRTEFYKIWARLIPKDVSVNPGQGLEDMLSQLAEMQRGSAPEQGHYIDVAPEPREDAEDREP